MQFVFLADETNNGEPQEAENGDETSTVEEGRLADETEAPASEDNTWVDESYQFIGASYQSLIGFYQTLIEQYLNEPVAAQSIEGPESLATTDAVSDVSTDVGELDTTDTSQDISVENVDTAVTNDVNATLESPVVLDNENQTSNVDITEHKNDL